MLKSLAILLLSAAVAGATIIPSDRIPPGPSAPQYWDQMAGVSHNLLIPGGIPNRTNIYVTLGPGNTAAQISSACNACPSNSVVMLSAGNYFLGGPIEWGDQLNGHGAGVTLRGAGMTNTILVWTNLASFVQAPIQVEGADRLGNGFPDATESTNETNKIIFLFTAPAQGATNLTLAKPQSSFYLGTHEELKAGVVICVDQLNDTFVNNVGSDGGFQLDDSSLRDNGARAQQQYTVVQSVTGGTNLTVWPPIYMTNYQSGLQPAIWWTGNSTAMCGVENLTIDTTIPTQINPATGNTYGQVTYSVFFWGCNECWVKGVHFIRQGNSSVATYNSAFCEVRDSFMDGAGGYGSGAYGVTWQLCSACLAENNAFQFISSPMLTDQGASGNVDIYNFCTNGIYIDTNTFTTNYYGLGNIIVASPTNNSNWMPPSIEPHYVHNDMNLFEGNYGMGVELDFTHGSGSHNTLFRNRFHGPEHAYQTGNVFPVQVQATNWYMNIVANVLGNNPFVTYTNYLIGSPTNAGTEGDSTKSIYKFGFVDDSGSTNFGDTNALFTALIHGNQDSFTSTNGGIVWNANIADHSPPNSFLYSSKPSWWGPGAWPPGDPLNPNNSGTNWPAYAILTSFSGGGGPTNQVYGVTFTHP